jgi:hypothetical protein
MALLTTSVRRGSIRADFASLSGSQTSRVAAVRRVLRGRATLVGPAAPGSLGRATGGGATKRDHLGSIVAGRT